MLIPACSLNSKAISLTNRTTLVEEQQLVLRINMEMEHKLLPFVYKMMLEFNIGTKKQDVQFGGLKGFQTDEKL